MSGLSAVRGKNFSRRLSTLVRRELGLVAGGVHYAVAFNERLRTRVLRDRKRICVRFTLSITPSGRRNRHRSGRNFRD
jgi:hypothetical protein